VKTSSGAIAVRVVWSSRRGSRSIEHLGSAHDESELEALKAAARQRLVEGQGEFDLGLDASGIAGGPLEIVSSRARHLWHAFCWVYKLVGNGFRQPGFPKERRLDPQITIGLLIDAPSERRTRETLGPEEFIAARQAGSAMSFDEAAAYALGEDP
jgi:hypothetical protein